MFVSDRNGIEHHVNRVGPGGTLGEMALVTGEPVSATVRAATELEVLVLSASEFHRAASAFPRIYQNVAAVLSRKLYYADRRSLDSTREVLAWLVDEGAPPLVGYELACSIAWHSRKPTLLLVLGETPSPELAAVANAADESTTSAAPRAYVRLIQSALAAGSVAQLVDELPMHFAHVLVQAGPGTPIPPGQRHIRLALHAAPPLAPRDQQAIVDGCSRMAPRPEQCWAGWHATCWG